MNDRGLTIVFTGNGKGKTTAALGQALRAAGHGFRVCMIQFVKKRKDTGEAKILADFFTGIELHTVGSGFIRSAKDRDVAKKAAAAGWALAKKKIEGGRYYMVILDEITYLLNDNLIDSYEMLSIIANRPAHVHLLLTGRDADRNLIDVADLVTEMKEIKHPFQAGIKARKGIEY